jgi:hypothetical protein
VLTEILHGEVVWLDIEVADALAVVVVVTGFILPISIISV